MFFLPTRIVFGDNALELASKHIAALGSNALIVCGKTSATLSGAMDDLLPMLHKLNISSHILDTIPENPDLECIVIGKEMLQETGSNFVIAIGGGSPLDAAKAISLAAANNLDINQLYSTELMHKRVPIVCIPTTHGTGSEVTQYSVLTNRQTKRKAGFGVGTAFPDIAVLDPKYTLSLPPRITMNTSLDALSHLLEGIYSKQRNLFLTPLIKKGIANVLHNLPLCLKEPQHIPSRAALIEASLYGGMVIAHSSTTLQHSIGYPLTSEFAIPHGLANGIVMKQIMELYYHDISDLIDSLFNSLNMTKCQFYDWLEQFPLDVQIPISDQMIEDKIPEIQSARNTALSPTIPSDEDIRSILKTLQAH